VTINEQWLIVLDAIGQQGIYSDTMMWDEGVSPRIEIDERGVVSGLTEFVVRDVLIVLLPPEKRKVKC
jgi:hypothetical protein